MRNFSRLVLSALVLLLAGIVIACSSNVAPTAPPPLAPTTVRPTNAAATRVPAAPTSATIATITPSSSANTAPPNTCPFTGMPLNDVNLATRRPLLVKLGNSPPERPQSGLAQADIVVEHLTEGAITRFAALFYCSSAADIGPIRSARLIDLELVPMFGAIFAHVGGSEPVRQMIKESEISQADFDDYGRAPIFREITERKRPFNRYTTLEEMYALAAKENIITGAAVPALQFSADIPIGGRVADKVTVPYRKNLSDAVFTYDVARNLYQRSTGTTPHLDPVSNQPLVATNVLVLYAPHETTNIVEDSLGSRSIKITLTGTGKATLLRDGEAFDLTWTRSDPKTLLQFTDASGKLIAFKPGNIWVEVVPTEMQVIVE
jgi:hypothetical protein